MANPRRKRHNRAPRRVVRHRTVRHRARATNAPRRHRRRTANPAHRRRRSNPRVVIHNRHHRRRNPGISGAFGSLKSLLYDSLAAIGGGVASRSVPELVLPNQNTGVLGYLLNLATAGIGSMAISKFTRNTRAGGMFFLGGVVMTAGRVIEDYAQIKLVEFGQFPAVLSGDHAYGLRGLYVRSSFPLPTDSLPPLLGPGPAAETMAVASNALSGAFSSPWN